MPSIRLGSFSAYLSLPHLFVTPTIPRRALIALVWVPSLSLPPDELQELVWVLAPPLYHLDTYQCPCPSREPRRMLSIRLGSFSVYLSPPHLSITATIPRRALVALVWVPSLSLSLQETPDELQELVWILAPSLHHLDTFPSREPRRMLGIHLGSFSVSTRSFHLCHRNYPQTSAISARLHSFAVSLISRNPRQALVARLAP